MPSYKVMLGKLVHPATGSHREEVSRFQSEVEAECFADPRLCEPLVAPIARVPTPVARNLLVQKARENKCDFLFMIDDDMRIASGFFKTAIDFLISHPEPALIAVPYCCGPPREDVQVFEWAAGSSGRKQSPWAVANIVREDAAKRKGIEAVCQIGTGCIGYRVEAFDRIKHPYYAYRYSDETHTQVIETEDCWCHRHLYFAGVKLYVDWDHWGSHWKSAWTEKPVILSRQDIDEMYLAQAKEIVRRELGIEKPKDANGKPQRASDGWTEMLDRMPPPRFAANENRPREVRRQELFKRQEDLERQWDDFWGESGKDACRVPSSSSGAYADPVGTCTAEDVDRILERPATFLNGEHVATLNRLAEEDVDLGEPDLWRAECTRVYPRPALMPQSEPFYIDDAVAFALSVPGWMHIDELGWLAEEASKLSSSQIWVEVGVWKGRSLAAVYLATQAKSVVAVDTWEGSPDEMRGAHAEAATETVYEQFLALRHELMELRSPHPDSPGPEILIRRRPSVLAAQTYLLAQDPQVVFLDAAHDEPSVSADIAAWWPLIAPGGMLCGHDRGVEGVKQAVCIWGVENGIEIECGPGTIWFARKPLMERREAA